MSESQNLKGRVAIMAVSFLGTLGLAMSALYLLATVLNFVSGFSQLSRFMIGTKDGLSYGFTLLIVPYLFIMSHLFFRSQLGNWLFNRGDFDLAQEFCEKRETHNLLRSRAESFANKSILLALLIRDGKWEEAREYFEAEEPKKKNAFYWRWFGWGAELYWRLDETEKLGTLFEKNGKAGKLAERYDAIRAHYYFEQGDTNKAMSILEDQTWNSMPSRIAVVSSVVKNEDLNEGAWETYLSQIPSATNEQAILSSKAIELGGEDTRTIRLIKEQLESEE